jgi:hypothetical protein
MRKVPLFFVALAVLAACGLLFAAWAQGTAKAKPKAAEEGAKRMTAPAEPDMDKGVTLDLLLTKSGPKDWSEKKGATIEGWVIQVEREKDGDMKMVLASQKGETSTTKWVIVEVPTTWQKKDPALSEDSLRALYGKKVQVTGWLEYDTKNDPDPRGTLWEIHPVTKITKGP